MSNTEFLSFTSNQVHSIFCALLPEVAKNFLIAIYLLEIAFYIVGAFMITKAIGFLASGGFKR